MRLAEKVVIITGSGQGIGRDIALRFAAEGAKVVVADTAREPMEEAVAAITAQGHEGVAIQADITDPVHIESLMQETLVRFGRLDILVNNAAIGLNKPFLTTTLDEWERQLQVNLTGTFLCAQAAARNMVGQGGGRIINIASISGQRGSQGRAAYGASKAGVILLTQVMAVELAPLGITVNAISPGPVDTAQSRGTHTPETRRAYLERIPLGRYGERAEIAAAALFLASDEASFVNGHILNVDGGFHATGLRFEDTPPD